MINFANNLESKLIESLPDAFVYFRYLTDSHGLDSNCIIDDTNPAFESMVGRSKAFLLGKPLSSLEVFKEQKALCDPYLFRAIVGSGESFEIEIKSSDTESYFDVIIYSDRQDYYAAIFRDITDRKKSEKRLRLFMEAVENSSDAIGIATPSGIHFYQNAAFLNLFGDLRDKKPNDSYVDQARFDEIFDRIKGGGRWNGEVGMYDRNSNKIEVYLKAYAINEDNGKIAGLIGIHSNITDQKSTEAKIRYMVFHDNLTKLYNRFYLNEEIKRLDTERQLPIAIIFADVNALKMINDVFGHNYGDQMLIKAAEILKESCRKEDIITRWGGDEFVVVLPQITEESVMDLCQRIEENCNRTFINGLPVSMAVGVAIKKSVNSEFKDLFCKAEDSMYQKKVSQAYQIRNKIIKYLLTSLLKKGYNSKQRVYRLRSMAYELGIATKLSAYDMERLKQLITLYELGKIKVAQELLLKKEALSAEEWQEIQKCPETGYKIVRSTEDFAHIAEEILCCREKWDGDGYPRGLKGSAIPILSRIATIVDAFDAMTSERPYKKKKSTIEAVSELKRCAGKQFDPNLVNAFEKIVLSERGVSFTGEQ